MQIQELEVEVTLRPWNDNLKEDGKDNSEGFPLCSYCFISI